MSHFAEMKVKFDQKHEDALVAALESVVGQGGVEVHETPQELQTYRGTNATKQSHVSGMYAPPCHLIVRRETLEKLDDYGLSNDAGYLRTPDGKYKAYIDEAGLSDEKQKMVSAEYAAIVFKKETSALGYVTRREELGQGRYQLVAEKY